MKRYLYHVSPIVNTESILDNGIKRKRGHAIVFLSENPLSWFNVGMRIFKVDTKGLECARNKAFDLDEILVWGDIPASHVSLLTDKKELDRLADQIFLNKSYNADKTLYMLYSLYYDNVSECKHFSYIMNAKMHRYISNQNKITNCQEVLNYIKKEFYDGKLNLAKNPDELSTGQYYGIVHDGFKALCLRREYLDKLTKEFSDVNNIHITTRDFIKYLISINALRLSTDRNVVKIRRLCFYAIYLKALED